MSLTVTREEWRWVARVALAVTVLSAIPWIVAALSGPRDHVHIGTYFNHWDFGQYAAAMHEGATSPSWLVHDHFSAEPHEPIWIFPLYVAIGKLAAALGLPALWTHRVAEVAMRIAVIFGLYLFVAAVVLDPSSRRAGLLLALFTGGLTVWLGIARGLLGQGWSTSGEFAAFGSLFAAPHIGLGLTAVVLSVVGFGAAYQNARYAVVLAAASLVAVGLLYPFYLPVVLGVCAASLALESLQQRRVPARAAGLLAVCVLVSLPFILYHLSVFALDPFWSQTYGAQNETPSPPPWELPANLGMAALVAPAGIAALRKGAAPQQRLLLLMLGFGLILMYTPVPFQRRFAFAVHATLAAVAAIGWPIVWQLAMAAAKRLSDAMRMLSPHRSDGAARAGLGVRRADNPPRQGESGHPALARRLVLYPLLLFGCSTPLVSYVAVVASAAAGYPLPIYTLDRDTYEVGRWIAAASGPDDVTLASYWTGNALGGLLPGRVVLGHETATLHAERKGVEVQAFYRGAMTPPEITAFLAQNRVSYVVVGPAERRIGLFDPGRGLGLPIATRVGDATAYRVHQLPR